MREIEREGEGGGGGGLTHVPFMQSPIKLPLSLDVTGESRATWQQLYLITWKSKWAASHPAPCPSLLPGYPVPRQHMGLLRVSFTSPPKKKKTKNAAESRLQYTYSFNITTQGWLVAGCVPCTAGEIGNPGLGFLWVLGEGVERRIGAQRIEVNPYSRER